MGKRVKSKKKKGMRIFVIALVVLILVAGGLLGYKIFMGKDGQGVISLGEDNGIKDEKKNIKIFNGKERPIAIMIDNHSGAWPQAGLNDTYAIYEIIVEGGETRMMALFKGKDTDKIGPVRSSRHYFLDYAMENDAIYTHYGWSPQAESDIGTYRINNINGISESEKDFWRIKDKAAPHNVLTSIKNIKKIAEKKKYRMTSSEESVLNYSADEINLNSEQVANKITIPYSELHTTAYTYDANTQRYIRYARGKQQTDYSTKEPITTKNIIITFAQNYELKDSEHKDRQGINNVGTLDGYYITNGKAEKIKCEKTARDKKTIYKDLNGNVIQVNDGNTIFNICPSDSKVTFE